VLYFTRWSNVTLDELSVTVFRLKRKKNLLDYNYTYIITLVRGGQRIGISGRYRFPRILYIVHRQRWYDGREWYTYTYINDRVYNRYEGEVLTDFVSRGIERMNVGGEWGEKSEYGRESTRAVRIYVRERRRRRRTVEALGCEGVGGEYEIWNFVIRSPVYISYHVYIWSARDTDTEQKRVGNGRGVWSGEGGRADQ